MSKVARRAQKKPVIVPPEPMPVTYRYALNTKEEVSVLVNYYAGLIYTSSDSDEIMKFAERIRFLEEQLTKTFPRPWA